MRVSDGDSVLEWYSPADDDDDGDKLPTSDAQGETADRLLVHIYF